MYINPEERLALICETKDAERNLDGLLCKLESILAEGNAHSDDYRSARIFARSLHGHAAHLDALAEAEDRLRTAETVGYMRSLHHQAAVNASLR